MGKEKFSTEPGFDPICFYRQWKKLQNSTILVIAGIFPEKYAMIYENLIILKKSLESDSKEKFYYKKILLIVLFVVKLTFFS